MCVLAPFASAASNDPTESAIEKCDALSGMEQRWCIRNNAQLRRHDISSQYRGARLDKVEERRTFMLQQRESRRKLRMQYSDTLQSTETTPSTRREAMRALQKKRRELAEEQREENKEFRRGSRSDIKRLNIEERTSRRAFQQNAKAFAEDRRKALLKYKSERYEFHQKPLLLIEEEEENEES